jgi:hypothetical protein
MGRILTAIALVWFAFRMVRGSIFIAAILVAVAAVLFFQASRSFSLARNSPKELH